MKTFSKWLEDFDPSASQVRAFQGGNIEVDQHVLSILRPTLERVTKLYPDNKEALQQVIAASEYVLLGVSRNASSTQIARELGTPAEAV